MKCFAEQAAASSSKQQRVPASCVRRNPGKRGKKKAGSDSGGWLHGCRYSLQGRCFLSYVTTGKSWVVSHRWIFPPGNHGLSYLSGN